MKSKQALEVLGYIGGYIIPTSNGNQHLKDFCDREFAILKQALLELKQIKETKPSEAMESLERIDKEYATIENEDFKICFNTIKQALLKAQEQEKALDIIIKKNIDIGALSKSDNYNEYNHFMQVFKSCVANYKSLYFITQEEFKLLKEVLER